jgi:hypothetical protein
MKILDLARAAAFEFYYGPPIPLAEVKQIFRAGNFSEKPDDNAGYTLSPRQELTRAYWLEGPYAWPTITYDFFHSRWASNTSPGTWTKTHARPTNHTAYEQPRIDFYEYVSTRAPKTGRLVLMISHFDIDMKERHVHFLLDGVLSQKQDTYYIERLVVNGKFVTDAAAIPWAKRYAKGLVGMIFDGEVYDPEKAWEAAGAPPRKLRHPSEMLVPRKPKPPLWHKLKNLTASKAQN